MRWVHVGFVCAVMTVGIALGRPFAAQRACLHGSDITPEQKARRSQVIGLARDINNQQVEAMKKSKRYSALTGLALTRPVPEGLEITLAADAEGYSFSIVDRTDHCRSGVFSNQAGSIYTGQALR